MRLHMRPHLICSRPSLALAVCLAACSASFKRKPGTKCSACVQAIKSVSRQRFLHRRWQLVGRRSPRLPGPAEAGGATRGRLCPHQRLLLLGAVGVDLGAGLARLEAARPAHGAQVALHRAQQQGSSAPVGLLVLRVALPGARGPGTLPHARPPPLPPPLPLPTWVAKQGWL